MIKKIFILVFILSLFLPRLALAEASSKSEVPELNPLCWKQAECETARKSMMSDDKAKEGWVQNISGSLCNKEGWGHCMAGSEVTTSIAIAGKTKFIDLGDYLITIYKYAIGLVSIFAVLMIIAGGVQWLTSAGSPEAITSAKKRIFGAIIGLVITYLSYVILYTINPALVSLRLPRTWLIKEQRLVPEYCSALPSSTMLALVSEYDKQNEDVTSKVLKVNSSEYKYSYQKNYFGEKEELKNQLYCGKRFTVKDGGGATCMSDYCALDNGVQRVCVPFGVKANQANICEEGIIGGQITCSNCGRGCNLTDVQGDGWEYPDAVASGVSAGIGAGIGQGLYAVCKDKSKTSLIGNVFGDKSLIYVSLRDLFVKTREKDQMYVIGGKQEDIENVKNKCGGTVRGFVIQIEMNEDCEPFDETHWLGKDGEKAKDLGDVSRFKNNVVDGKILSTEEFDKYLITENDLKVEGFHLNIDATYIKNFDSDYSP
jgi:hypothetical protein